MTLGPYLESRDAETGEVQWQWNTEPGPGAPGFETWPDADARNRGGGMTWMTGTYDSELRLRYWGSATPIRYVLALVEKAITSGRVRSLRSSH
jgi:hypothetical protein